MPTEISKEASTTAVQVPQNNGTDWRTTVKARNGMTVAELVQERDHAVQDSMDIERKKARVHNLLLRVGQELGSTENPTVRFSKASYDSENLVLKFGSRACELNVEFQDQFLRVASNFEFTPMVVSELRSTPQFRLVDFDGVTITLEADRP
ncbi:MAG: hypothetical protein KGH94_04400 [Candidatus Micrarchaeota archaeon]|nr:hypothetical protein [Candidatus Micrarchaeota archaeon]